MTETTRFVSKGTGILMLLVIAAIVVFLTWLAQERYLKEEQRDCMSALSRPTEGERDYDDKMLHYTADVRGCLRG
jgi:hypothetical protein